MLYESFYLSDLEVVHFLVSYPCLPRSEVSHFISGRVFRAAAMLDIHDHIQIGASCCDQPKLVRVGRRMERCLTVMCASHLFLHRSRQGNYEIHFRDPIEGSTKISRLLLPALRRQKPPSADRRWPEPQQQYCSSLGCSLVD